jgi:N utilization substance protein A
MQALATASLPAGALPSRCPTRRRLHVRTTAARPGSKIAIPALVLATNPTAAVSAVPAARRLPAGLSSRGNGSVSLALVGGHQRSQRASRACRARVYVTRAASQTSFGAEFPVRDRRDELTRMTVAQLKPMCKGSELKIGGKKSELVKRLLEHEFGTSDVEADIDPKEDIMGLAQEWRSGRVVGGGDSGVSLGELDSVQKALASAGFGVDERAADAAYYTQSYQDGGREDQANAGGVAARVVGREGGVFDDGGGSGWDRGGGNAAGADAWERRDGDDRGRDTDRHGSGGAPPAPEVASAPAVDPAAKARAARNSLAKRSAIVTALRQLATEREGFESDPRVHLEAVSRAIDRAYKKLRYSQYAQMDPRSRDVCVDINVSEGTLAVLAQRVGRGGTVEWEIDDTDDFLAAYSKRHMMRQLAFMFTEELSEQVALVAANSYRARVGEMVEATVVTEGARGEYLLKLDDGAFACLPAEEAIPDKRYTQGDRLSALVLEVEERTWAGDRRAPVVVSTAIAGLLALVLAAEVPEVARGDVIIKSVARVSGKMSKVAVARREGAEGVWDPVLACVGHENSRMQAIRERLGGEVCQILTWSDNLEAMIAESLFPANVHHVEKGVEEGDSRRLTKYVAYVKKFEEAKAIGVGGMNVKLAAALCGVFILIERFEDDPFGGAGRGGFGGNGDDWRNDSRGGDTRGGGFGGGGGWGEEDRSGDRGGRGIDIGSPGDGFDDLGWPDLQRGGGGEAGGGDVGGGFDDLGWPDLQGAGEAQSRFGDLLGGGGGGIEDFSAAAEGAISNTAAAAGAFNSAADAAAASDDDAVNWEEVGPGKVGVVTFGANLGAGITGSCTFMGDAEMLPSEAGDEMAAGAANGAADYDTWDGDGDSIDDGEFLGEGSLPAWGAEEEALFGGSEDDFFGNDNR